AHAGLLRGQPERRPHRRARPEQRGGGRADRADHRAAAARPRGGRPGPLAHRRDRGQPAVRARGPAGPRRRAGPGPRRGARPPARARPRRRPLAPGPPRPRDHRGPDRRLGHRRGVLARRAGRGARCPGGRAPPAPRRRGAGGGGPRRRRRPAPRLRAHGRPAGPAHGGRPRAHAGPAPRRRRRAVTRRAVGPAAPGRPPLPRRRRRRPGRRRRRRPRRPGHPLAAGSGRPRPAGDSTPVRRAVAAALSRGGRSPPPLQVAHHSLAAADAGPGDGADAGLVDRAIRWGRAAADQARRETAFETAVAFLSRVVALHDRLTAGDDRPVRARERACELRLELAEAHDRAGEFVARDRRHLEAADLARELGRTDLFVRAALGYGGRLPAAPPPNPTARRLLEEALALLPEEDSRARALVLARLAHVLHAEAPHHERKRLADEAEAMARRLDAPVVLASVLSSRVLA